MAATATITYRRWRKLVGGELAGRPVPEFAWLEPGRPLNVQGKLVVSLAVQENGELAPLEQQRETERQYRLMKITVGRTRLVLKAWVAGDVPEAEAMELIWLELMRAVGS